MTTATIVTGQAPIVRDIAAWNGEPFDLTVSGDVGDGVEFSVAATAGGATVAKWNAADGVFALEAVDLPAGATFYNVTTEHSGEDALRAYGRLTRRETIRPTIAATDVSAVAALSVVEVQPIDDDPSRVQTIEVDHGGRLQVTATPAGGATLRLTLSGTEGGAPVAHFASTTAAINVTWAQLSGLIAEGGRLHFSLWEDDGADLRLMARGVLVDIATIRGEVSTVWLLAGGVWNDSGVWDDAATWED